MAKPASWISHVEAFVDTARPAKEQAASLDAIVALLKNDLLTIEALVREMELYLTTTDHIIRARGILFLAEILSCLASKPLDNATITSLVGFFTSRLADWQALRGALVGCLALLRRKSNIGTVAANDARTLAQSFLTNVQVQALAVHDRKLCFEVLQCLLDFYPESVINLGDDLVYGICEAIDEEKDPRCLILTFHLVEILVRLFPDPSGSVASFAGDLFEILGRYFPIYFTHPRSDDFEIKRDDLSKALMHAFCSTPFFEPLAIPLLLDKLSSSLQLAKLDSLKYLNSCIVHYGRERMVKHANPIWSALKDVIFSSPHGIIFPSTSESAGHIESEEIQIAEEALTCLKTAISQLDCPDSDLFISLIVDDDDIEAKFSSLSTEKSYSEISKESQHQLGAFGSILSTCSKVSTGCCSRVFQKFFPRLMNILGVSFCSSYSCITDYKNFSKTLTFGALYLCVELLSSCRDLTLAAQSLSPQVEDAWWYLLHDFTSPLTYAFGSTLVKPGSIMVLKEDVGPEHVFYGVKGLQSLATFPGCYSPLSEDVYEDILATLMSGITDRSDDTFLWKLSLNSVVQIGSFIEKFHDSKKGVLYNKVVVERIISLLPLDDSTLSLALKLEAISEIGITGLDFMLKVIQGLEEAIFSNFSEAYVDDNSRFSEVLVCLLECYSNHVLPWCQKSGKFEEVAMHFAFNIWNQMESIIALKIDPSRQGLLDATMMAMKTAVGDCTVENQGLVVQKAFSILSSTTCLLLAPVLFPSTKLEWLQVIPGLSGLSYKDEWLMSLFASTVIALRPQTPLPDLKILFKLFMVFLFKGHNPAAEALASVINKLPANTCEGVSSAYTLEEAVDVVLESLFTVLCSSPLGRCNFMNSDEGCLSCCPKSFQTHAVVGLAWIGKGLLMRGHERVKEIAMLLLKCLIASQSIDNTILHQNESGCGMGQDVHLLVARSAADAFHILLSDSEACLNKKFHATVRPLYKQRFFSSMMPVLLSSIKESNSSITRTVLYRALGHVICDTPLTAVIAEAKKVIPPLLDGLSVLSPDFLNKDMTYSLLLVLSGILMDENGREAIMDNVHLIITHLIKLISYPHMMLVRETAIQCLVAISGLPHARIYPMRPQVLRALSKSLDDPKRGVRQEAVRCRQAWASIASRSLHF